MSYNGSGTFTINSTGQPVVAGTVITASAFNALTADLATGLTTAITKDGQTTTTARITFAQGLTSSLTTDSSSTTTGSIITAGGVGIAKNLYVGGSASFSAQPIFTSLTASSAVATDASKGLVSVTNTGTGNNVLGTAPTISLPVIDNIKMGYSTTATAAGTTTLTASSNYRQFFTGSTTQTIVLPVTSTLVTGIAYEIENNSTGLLTVNSSGGNLVGTIPAGVCAHAVCIGTTLTTAADWDWDYISTTTITGTGANVLGTSPTIATPTITGDATISGLTVGKGGGAVSTNTAVGASALNATNTGGKCTAFGYQALTLTTGKENTAFGSSAGASMTSGEGLAAFGWNAANLNTGDNNTAIGHNSLAANTTAANNTAIGNAALNANTTGASNVAVGRQALVANTTASNNTAIGFQAAQSNTTGNGGIFIGQGAGTTRATTGDFNILIGATAQNSATGGSYEIVIGTNNPTGKGSSTGFINAGGGGVYQGNNSATWSVTSDQRLKKNIVDNTDGLEKLLQIKVRNFEYRLPEEVTELPQEQAIQKQGIQLGAIAQELQQILPECVKTETTGVMTVDTDNLTWYLINAVKELSARVKQLEGN